MTRAHRKPRLRSTFAAVAAAAAALGGVTAITPTAQAAVPRRLRQRP